MTKLTININIDPTQKVCAPAKFADGYKQCDHLGYSARHLPVCRLFKETLSADDQRWDGAPERCRKCIEAQQ